MSLLHVNSFTSDIFNACIKSAKAAVPFTCSRQGTGVVPE